MSSEMAVLLMSHGNFAKAAIESAELIVGKQENVDTVGVFAIDNVDQLKQDVLAKIEKLDTSRGLIILTDIVGGTPTNLASALLTKDNMLVCSGLNLPLLLEVLMNRDGNLQELRESLPLAYQNGLTIRTQQDLLTQEEEDDLL